MLAFPIPDNHDDGYPSFRPAPRAPAREVGPSDLRVVVLAEIEAFLAARPRRIAETTFGARAVNDGKFVQRLRDRKNVTLDRIDRCREFMARERAEWSKPAEAA